MSVVWTQRADKKDLDAQFCYDVNKFLSESPYNWYVTFGYRSIELQAKLYAAYLAYDKYLHHGGPKVPFAGKAAPPGKSAHNFGMAVDVVWDSDSLHDGLQPGWNTKAKAWIWLKVNVYKHPRLHSLWSIGDWGHIERYKWYNLVHR